MSIIKEFKFNDHSFFEIKPDFIHISSYDVIPIDGYIKPDEFPLCCPYHTSISENVQKWFDKFPDCCVNHKELVNKGFIKKEDYSHLPDKIINQLSFTESHIANRIDNTDWYEDITEYIDYNVDGFGHPSIGAAIFLEFLIQYLEIKNNIDSNKKQRIIKFIKNIFNPVNINESQEPFDLNIVISTYQKWLNVFPFELSYFQNLKEHFSKKLPLISGKIKNNRYSGIVKAKMHTRNSLIQYLVELTETLLIQINGVSLYEMGLVTDINKLQIEILNESRKLEINQLCTQSVKKKEQYTKVIKKWFNGEKKYFKELSALLLKGNTGIENKVDALTQEVNEIRNENKQYHNDLLTKLGANGNFMKDVITTLTQQQAELADTILQSIIIKDIDNNAEDKQKADDLLQLIISKLDKLELSNKMEIAAKINGEATTGAKLKLVIPIIPYFLKYEQDILSFTGKQKFSSWKDFWKIFVEDKNNNISPEV